MFKRLNCGVLNGCSDSLEGEREKGRGGETHRERERERERGDF